MWLAAVRDVAIVLLALETLIIGVLLALTLMQIRKLVRLLRDEIRPMLDSANETLNTVQGTANFVSDTVVDPVIKATSYSVGTWRALQSLLFIGRRIARHSNDDGDFWSSIE